MLEKFKQAEKRSLSNESEKVEKENLNINNNGKMKSKMQILDQDKKAAFPAF